MLFETIRCENGIVQNINLHELRIQKSSGIKIDLSFLKPPDNGVFRCKVIYDQGKILSSEFVPYVKKQIKTLKIIESHIEYRHKFLDRSAIDKLSDIKGGADDILIIRDGFITDTAIANVAFLDKNGKWLTPKTPLLHGIMRQKLLNEGVLLKRDVRVEDMDAFYGIAIMNALRGFEPLGNIRDVIKF